MKTVVSISALSLLALPSVASANVVNVSQSRAVQARASFVPNVDDSTAATGPWNASVTNITSPDFPSGGTGSQTSSVSTTRFNAVGSVSANDYLQGYSGGASSAFEATFDVTANTAYSLVGSWTTNYDFFALAPAAGLRFERLSPNPAVFHHSFFFDDTFSGGSFQTAGSANLAGVLTPGRYRVAVNVNLSVFGNPGIFSGGGSYNLDLIVPTPAVATLAPMVALAGLRRRR